ncbi:MAG: hypothetical protein JWL90_3344 [Chthoniobacteraceae bacterium]|nr:hypothetical protein [Chthoniobacteraceae bacterium]MDB6173223.1 hypothetical protein [Chthoniobacteraceae bacterium]
MKTEARPKIEGRIKRIVGQINGIQRMIEQERYCVDILNQISAVRSALDGLGIELLTGHLETCVVGCGSDERHAKAKPMKREELMEELRTALSRFLK